MEERNDQLTRMQKVVLLLTFWFTPPTEEKYQYWVDFAGEIDLTEDEVLDCIAAVVDGVDESELALKWAAFDPFVEETSKNMR